MQFLQGGVGEGELREAQTGDKDTLFSMKAAKHQQLAQESCTSSIL